MSLRRCLHLFARPPAGPAVAADLAVGIVLREVPK